MSENPLSGHLLKALIVLLDEESVTRAASRLNLSQPAASLMLKQLREIFGDPLLVRAGGGMVRTERGEHLRGAARQMLTELDHLVLDPDEFNPSVSRATFTIAMPDHMLPLMFNGVMQEFRRQAPLARLSIRPLSTDYDFEGALAAGAADLVISNWPKPPEYLKMMKLFEDEFVCLVDRNHPFAKRHPTRADYIDASHIAPGDYAIAHRGVVETYLSEINLPRQRCVIVGYFSMAPYLLPGTDLVFTVTRRFAEHFATFLPLAIVPSPIAFPPVCFYQLWHERMQHSHMHRWLRQLVGSMNRLSMDLPTADDRE